VTRIDKAGGTKRPRPTGALPRLAFPMSRRATAST
jgi:hypothetical protein